MDSFFEGSFVDWASFDVCGVVISAYGAFDWTILVLGALDYQVVFTTFDASSFMVAIILCMSIVLINRESKLRNAYKNSDDSLGNWLKMFFGLQFINHDEVEDAFVELIAVCPNKEIDHIFSDYVLKNYIEPGYPFNTKLWTMKPSENPSCTLNKSRIPENKETWWWNEEIQRVVASKKKQFKLWQKSKTRKDWVEYKSECKIVKSTVSEAKLKRNDELYERLGTEEGEKEIEDKKVLTKEDDVKKIWKEYFESLVNEEYPKESLENVSWNEGLIDLVGEEEDMYDSSNTSFKSMCGVTEDLKVGVEIQGEVPWCMMFADDIVLIGENLEDVNNRLNESRLAIEGKGLRISRNKTEYIEYAFGGKDQELDVERRPMTVGEDAIKEVESIKYLGSVVQKDGAF
ncbi:hypothetical protein QTP88_018227 [Uroleucon formosanum]